jgi:hypothetical protein
MRVSMMGFIGVAFVAAACSTTPGGSSTSGTTTSTGSTTSGTAGTSGTTAGTTTSGTGSTTGTTGTSGTPGATCTSNAQCQSNICGINGAGRCCSAACTIGDATCGATACDDTGACIYPMDTTACGAASCAGDMLTKQVCSGQGSCVPNAAAPCPNGFACQDATSCKTTCTVAADCATGFYCNGDACLAQQATGACTRNDACTSGICGAGGMGHCCTAACSTTDPVCGVLDCDGTGACVYPPATTSCGTQNCKGHTQSQATNCDGLGTCIPPVTIDCSPYVCGATICLTTCTDNTSCIAAGFCDDAGSTCCGLASGGIINADAITGSDANVCCGLTGSKGPCQTLTQAMTSIVAAQATNVILNATVDGGGGDWTAPETYPVILGLGVELTAPGVFFDDAYVDAGVAIFDIDAGNASIVGNATSPVNVGMNSDGSAQTDAISTIQVEANNTLYIANASVNGSFNNLDSLAAIGLQGNASLVLGQDQSAGVTGTVQIGNALGNQATDGYGGIVCNGDIVHSLGCTVTDAVLMVGQSSVIMQGQEGADIQAIDFSNISLMSSPVIGVPPTAAGFGMCPFKPDGQFVNNGLAAVWVTGKSNVSLQSASVQCIAGTAFFQQADTTGVPTVTIDRTVIQNTDTAIYASAGTTTVTNSTLNYNFIGVWQDTDANDDAVAIDLSGGSNTVICSSNVESSQGSTFPGIDVYNTNTANLKADNVAWDTAGPDYFQCDDVFASCTCNNASCTTTAGSDDMDAVQGTTVLPDGGIGVLGSITTTMNTQAANGCN